MSMSEFERRVLSRPGAAARVAALERELLVAHARVESMKKAEEMAGDDGEGEFLG